MDQALAEAIASELRRDPAHSLRSAAAAMGAVPPRVTGMMARVERQQLRGERSTDAELLAYSILTEALEERHRLLRSEATELAAGGAPGGVQPDFRRDYYGWLRHLLETSDRKTHGAISRTELTGADDAPGVLESRENFETVEARVRAAYGADNAKAG